NAVMAMNNCWDESNLPNTLADAEAVIVHQVDDASLGLVSFDPVSCESLSIADTHLKEVAIYPNPTNGLLNISNNNTFEQITIYSMDGKLLMQKMLQRGTNKMHLDLNAGMYILEFNGENAKTIKKLIVK
ncbi:MAG: T9SS type A sorting domain-containing protein, partial [Xanthomarina sp.]